MEPRRRWLWVDSAETSDEEDARHKNYQYDQMRLDSVGMSLSRPVSAGEGSGTCGLRTCCQPRRSDSSCFFDQLPGLSALRNACLVFGADSLKEAIRALKVNQHEVGRAGTLSTEVGPDTSNPQLVPLRSVRRCHPVTRGRYRSIVASAVLRWSAELRRPTAPNIR